MVWLNNYRMVVVGILAALVVGGGSAKADFTFGEPVNLGPMVNSTHYDGAPCISSDGLELYFASNRDGGIGKQDLWVAKRATTDDEWGQAENLGEIINNIKVDENPTLSSDGLELYFNSQREDGLGSGDLWMTTRTTRNDPWDPPINLGPTVNNAKDQTAPSISSDGLELYFYYYDPTLPDDDPVHGFYVTRRETKDDPWGEPVSLGSVVNSWYCTWECEISGDGLLLTWADYGGCEPREDGFGGMDLWYSRRATKDSEWGEPVNLGPAVNTPFSEGGPAISADGSILYFRSDHCGKLGGFDIWQVPILPVVDFDDDGSVGISDLLILVEAWETDDPKCDIGPMPWGDGVVDEADLEVLMDHWGQDMYPLTEPLAHWTLDETEGTTARDRSGVHNADLFGDPVWLPEGGMVGGALEFDGNGDYIKTPFVTSPMEGSLSVFAWIQGGAPGQAIISDKLRFNWLTLDIEGNLATPIMPTNATDVLSSQTQVTDGQWHHVGLVWDFYPLNRILYVDGVEVARDVASGGSGGSYMGHYIGASWGLHSSSFWSGLIDDVRIYDTLLSAEEVAALVQ